MRSILQFALGAHRVFHILAIVLLLLPGNIWCASYDAPDIGGISADVTYRVNASVNAERRQGIDSSLQRYAFMALSNAETEVIYDVALTPYFNGITAQVIRLRSSTLRSLGFIFNEFTIPEGFMVNSSFVVLVYRKISNFTIYSLPEEYDFVGPVVGIVPYVPTNTSVDFEMLQDLSFTETPILIRVPISSPVSEEVPLCAFFDADGTAIVTNVSSLPNVCTSMSFMDVCMILPSLNVSPESTATPSIKWPPFKRQASRTWKVPFGATFGAVLGLSLLCAVTILMTALAERIRIAIMEHFAGNKETLQIALIGHSRAPTAAGLRTRPTIETEKFSAGSSHK